MKLIQSHCSFSDLKDIQAVVIAGGQARRMGGLFKGSVLFQNKPLLQWVVERLSAQGVDIAINLHPRFQDYDFGDLPFFLDKSPFIGEGPLAGVRSALLEFPDQWLLTVPCDVPLLPMDYVDRMMQAVTKTDSRVVYVHDGKRSHPLFSLISPRVLSEMTDFLTAGNRKMLDWLNHIKASPVDFSDCAQNFINCNTYEQLRLLENQLTKVGCYD